MKTLRFLFLLGGAVLTLAACQTAESSLPESVRSARALAGRLIPDYQKNIIFRETPSDSTDCFTLSSEDGKIVISANDAGTMAVGLNYYLNHYCYTTVSQYAAHPVDMPSVLPPGFRTVFTSITAPSAMPCPGGAGRNGSASSTGWRSTESTCPWRRRGRNRSGSGYGAVSATQTNRSAPISPDRPTWPGTGCATSIPSAVRCRRSG